MWQLKTAPNSSAISFNMRRAFKCMIAPILIFPGVMVERKKVGQNEPSLGN
jgi:hypothetical protein